jgi:hypothetical protein
MRLSFSGFLDSQFHRAVIPAAAQRSAGIHRRALAL